MSFVSFRPLARSTCVHFQSNTTHSPPTWATNVLPKESIRLTRSPLIKLNELLDCTGEQRCQVQFDGMTLLILSDMKKVFNESELTERAGFSRDGVLIRGASPLASPAAETQFGAPDDEAPMGTPGVRSPTNNSRVEPPIRDSESRSPSSSQIFKSAIQPESRQSPTLAPMPSLSNSVSQSRKAVQVAISRQATRSSEYLRSQSWRRRQN